ncbi:YunG family protein [Sphingomonas nostoxanthinifaciens]|uniref:YunG family protein n=1 Tax=Sphingomonas nostoxanthinifaciens TaxID=2872652 RepID=UPI001CC20D54|nr:hypothetical protein [Sphingomonas nostoxanthinifaciens]UAK23590.1 hypothetical protein K8P63_14510 [Sphingomonas nostoxanthinifaciens]
MAAFVPVANIGSSSDHLFMQQRCISPIANPGSVDLPALTRALEASWDHLTSYQGVTRPGNPAFGQCYPTSRVVQWFYPEYEIAKGEVWTGSSVEQHFWNVRGMAGEAKWLDLSWEQFPAGSVVRNFLILDRNSLGDSERARERCALLLQRVLGHLAGNQD